MEFFDIIQKQKKIILKLLIEITNTHSHFFCKAVSGVCLSFLDQLVCSILFCLVGANFVQAVASSRVFVSLSDSSF